MAEEKSNKRILVIDDDITALDIVSYLFEEKGYEVQRSPDGKTATDYVRKSPPDLIIVDLMMPGISGVDTVREIIALGYTELPIIAFTAVDEPTLHEEALKAGCQMVLTKPCRPDRLVQHIRELLQDA